ncbi:class I SAM-dependent methyltransferase [Marinobacter gelidimuriae]|uniref:class I SAM-dependent methyltransferase n=1 Tax=Marinobacter gelidimuriae TaxID=2739064 RepID=UPI00037CC148|nr:class I SAM-dependent methyltransferase [Marinobacter gelidimuriae]
MEINAPTKLIIKKEPELFRQILPLKGACIVELGCGSAALTRYIANECEPASILACEVDLVQHTKNSARTNLPNVTFVVAGAESIPASDSNADIVLMFKSLHHVPKDRLADAMSEIYRVLRPGGLAYISEPIYAGDFNEILRLFHSEKTMRENAFEAVCNAVEEGVFELVGQHFFHMPRVFNSFEEFEQRMVNVTHTDHRLTPELLAAIEARYADFAIDGRVCLTAPMRVDLLRRPIA